MKLVKGDLKACESGSETDELKRGRESSVFGQFERFPY